MCHFQILKGDWVVNVDWRGVHEVCFEGRLPLVTVLGWIHG